MLPFRPQDWNTVKLVLLKLSWATAHRAVW